MILTVSVSQLRSNISEYLDRVMKGSRVFVRDEKKNITIAQITQTPVFDKKMYEKILRKSAGVLLKDSHPEWATKSKVTDWLIKSRLADERLF